MNTKPALFHSFHVVTVILLLAFMGFFAVTSSSATGELL
jgi:hypothetical protein